jgi:hypothetical protein
MNVAFVVCGHLAELQQVIIGHRCCVERGEISAARAHYPEPIPIMRARLSRTSFNVDENPYGFMS